MKNTQTLFVVLFFIANFQVALSQLYICPTVGVAMGLDESSIRGNQQFQFTYGGSALYNLKNITLVSSECSVYYTGLGTSTYNGENDYHTSVLSVDIRTRLYLNRDYLFSPYAGVGIGFSFFTNNSKPKNITNHIQSGAGAFVNIPIFVGANMPLNHRVDFDMQMGGVLTGTDHINPILNSTNDHWIYARIGLNIKVLLTQGTLWD